MSQNCWLTTAAAKTWHNPEELFDLEASFLGDVF
jgi:hypothetical protein